MDRAYPNLGLKGDWLLGEDGWKDDMDANLFWLSVIVQGRVIDQVPLEDGAPTEGMVYLLAAGHATHPNELAVYDEAAWHYRAPLAGWRFYNTTLGVFTQFSGTVWVNDVTGLTAEDVRDVISAALVAGTNINVVTNDGADTITVSSTMSAEDIMDAVAAMIAAGTNISVVYNDGADTLTISSTITGALLSPNNLSDLASPATARTNLGLLRLIPFFFTATPSSGELLAIYPCVEAFTFPANLAGSQVKKYIGSGANPSADFEIDVRKNNVSFATITIHPDGSVTLLGAATTTAAADVVTVHAPAGVDATIRNWALNLLGVL